MKKYWWVEVLLDVGLIGAAALVFTTLLSVYQTGQRACIGEPNAQILLFEVVFTGIVTIYGFRYVWKKWMS